MKRQSFDEKDAALANFHVQKTQFNKKTQL